jgi:hypothetical protein
MQKSKQKLLQNVDVNAELDYVCNINEAASMLPV